MFNGCFETKFILEFFQEFEFSSNYSEVLQAAEQWGKKQARIPKQMRTFEESVKSKKTVASMIERKGEDKENKKKGIYIFLNITC